MNSRLMYILVILVLGIGYLGATGVSVQDNSSFNVNNIGFRLDLHGSKRISNYTFQELAFSPILSAYADSTVIVYSCSEMDLTLCIKQNDNYDAQAWEFRARADFHSEIFLRELYFDLVFDDLTALTTYKGVAAINAEDAAKNINLVPYTDKVIEHRMGNDRFWIAASNYRECQNIEGLSLNKISLYDFKLHFFRRFRPSTNMADLPRDTMYKQPGDHENWGFLVFTEKPLLFTYNRWPAGKQAALAITNDADGEWASRLAPVYFGSNNPANPKYMQEGLIANHIPVSNTVFGINQPVMQDIWDQIYQHGNSIAYHTYQSTEDSLGTNAQALLVDLVPYNVRLWIDHSISYNPEDLGYNGLDPSARQYIGDVINQSSIDYAWMADTPPNNAFDCFDEPWRLPHRLWELTALEKPVWFFGRTRMNVWENLSADIQIDFKNTMTVDNLDRLLQNHGLHISYTHFCFANTPNVNSFHVIAPNGDYEIRPEFEELLKMLDYYQTHRGLWIATVEDIFDRMLATEKVRITKVEQTANEGIFAVTLSNDSDHDIAMLEFRFDDVERVVNLLKHGEAKTFYIDTIADDSIPVLQTAYRVGYSNNCINIRSQNDSDEELLKVELFNLRGQLVDSFSNVLLKSTVSIPIKSIGSGVYLVKVINGKATPSTSKVVIMK